MKKLIVYNAVLAYPNFELLFETVSYDHYRPITFFDRKLSSTKQRYVVIENELLSIMVIMKDFK